MTDYEHLEFEQNPQPKYRLPERVPSQRNHRVDADLRKLRGVYVQWKLDKAGDRYPCWNPDRTPDARDVHRMLDWYIRDGRHKFPEIRAVRLLSAAHANAYFLVTFRPADDLEGRSRLPGTVILRLVLPACPFRLLDAEIGAMALAARFSDWVPEVLVFDSSGQNPLALEWLVMAPPPVAGFLLQDCLYDLCACETGLRGLQPADECEVPSLTRTQQERVRKGVARLYEKMGEAATGLDDLGFRGIGSVGVDWETGRLRLAPVVADEFCRDERFFDEGKDWGPFPSVSRYMDEYCRLAFQHLPGGERRAAMEEVRSLFSRDGQLSKRMKARLDGGSAHGARGGYTLCHTNLHSGNVLVDSEGEIVWVMGWEKAVLLPTAWRRTVADMDEFIEGNASERVRKTLQKALDPFVLMRSALDKPTRFLKWETDHNCPGREATVYFPMRL